VHATAIPTDAHEDSAARTATTQRPQIQMFRSNETTIHDGSNHPTVPLTSNSNTTTTTTWWRHPAGANFSWCLPEHYNSNPPGGAGLFYVKLPKCASSTAVGVTLRIADAIGTRVWRNQSCFARYRHGTARINKYKDRLPSQSFLWSTIRHPSNRTLSAYFFYQVSRRKANATAASIMKYLRDEQFKSFYVRYLALNEMNATAGTMTTGSSGSRMLDTIHDILHRYDFIAVSERMAESLVVLSMLLHIPIAHVVLLSSKIAGGYDGGRSKRFRCTQIQSKWTVPAIDDYLNGDFLADNWDYLLYRAVNASLDRTIDTLLGRDQVEAGVLKYRRYHDKIQRACLDKAVFPCPITHPNQTLLSREDCYFSDAGCGHGCIDRILANDAVAEWG
jgi:Galactose-3-O-sulfotransferase